MSAFISFVSAEGAYLLSDGAVTEGDERILVEDRRKIVFTQDCAMTARGHTEVCDWLGEQFLNFAESRSAAEAWETFPLFAHAAKEKYGIREGADAFEVIGAFYIPGIGGKHGFFNSKPHNFEVRSQQHTLPAYGVMTPGPFFPRGAGITPNIMTELGLMMDPAKSTFENVKRSGLGLMQHMRGKVCYAGEKRSVVFSIGGHVDLLAMTTKGASLECIHTWPDRIGEPIRPDLGRVAA